MGGVTHTDVAAYVLGVLDKDDAAKFETHLLECPHCQLDLLEFHELPEILDEIRWHCPAPPRPVSRDLHRLPNRVAGARRRRRLLVGLVGVAAALLIIAVPLVMPTPRSPGVSGASKQVAVSQASAAPSASVIWWSNVGGAGQVEATVAVRGTAWGSQIDLGLTDTAGPRRCGLFAISWAGEAQVIATWMVPAPDGGSAPQPVRVSGGTAFAPDQIQKFEVRTDDGTTVLATITRSPRITVR